MPKGVDHDVWEKAKTQAGEQGKGKNWPYVMSIYQSMKGNSSAEKPAKKNKYSAIIDVISKFLK